MGDPLRFVMTTYEELMGIDKEEEEMEDNSDERVQVEESKQDM